MKIIYLEDFKVEASIPDSATLRKCKSCGVPMFFATVPKIPRPHPVFQRPDGTWISHFTNCPNAKGHRSKK